MKGKYGTPMQGIEVKPKKHGNHYCKNCQYLKLNILHTAGKRKNSPYMCEKTKKGMYYTSFVWCKRFKKKEPETEA